MIIYLQMLPMKTPMAIDIGFQLNLMDVNHFFLLWGKEGIPARQVVCSGQYKMPAFFALLER